MRPMAALVEDSPTQARIIALMIEAQGWQCQHFETLREAGQVLAHTPVQAVFLDVFVGPYNALLQVGRFRQLAPSAPIIVMTAGSPQEDIEETLTRARLTKADFVLRKPFTSDQMSDILDISFDKGAAVRRPHILVIDDSDPIRTVARNTLEAAGYRVSDAASMEDAFGYVELAQVDLVLCELFMPGIGGLRGIREIKAAWPQVKVVAMSAGLDTKISGEEALSISRKMGSDAQLSKPFDPADLAQLVDLMLRDPAMLD
ncbi:response regulator [Asticcacaulis machinosus]|uniref:Response regulator n=1 Tax=Asticcacaulis machinosus TaxID=2984211 RepID=A0ABT5HGP0_9CAUL|nr:response regulator [Asticcacaulis machinosus]MDC7675421.1 response regulator [Asticcacaulis machinosus]